MNAFYHLPRGHNISPISLYVPMVTGFCYMLSLEATDYVMKIDKMYSNNIFEFDLKAHFGFDLKQ